MLIFIGFLMKSLNDQRRQREMNKNGFNLLDAKSKIRCARLEYDEKLSSIIDDFKDTNPTFGEVMDLLSLIQDIHSSVVKKVKKLESINKRK